IDRIDGYPGFANGVPGYELCPLAQEQAADAGAELSMAELQELHPRRDRDADLHLTTGDGELRAGAVILATGAGFRTLGIPGEERLTGHGVSHCASCDAPLLRGRRAAVIGGGD